MVQGARFKEQGKMFKGKGESLKRSKEGGKKVEDRRDACPTGVNKGSRSKVQGARYMGQGDRG